MQRMRGRRRRCACVKAVVDKPARPHSNRTAQRPLSGEAAVEIKRYLNKIPSSAPPSAMLARACVPAVCGAQPQAHGHAQWTPHDGGTPYLVHRVECENAPDHAPQMRQSGGIAPDAPPIVGNF